jgi:hypothetical protein
MSTDGGEQRGQAPGPPSATGASVVGLLGDVLHDERIEADLLARVNAYVNREAEVAEIERFLRLAPPDRAFRKWLAQLLFHYQQNIKIAFEKMHWANVAARIEHASELARQIVDHVAELEALLKSLYLPDAGAPMSRQMEDLAQRVSVSDQGLDIWALEKQLRQIRQPVEYLRLVQEARDLGVNALVEQSKEYAHRLKPEHLIILLKGPAPDVAALVARLKAEAPLAAAALLERPKHPGGRPSPNWSWNKLMASVADYYDENARYWPTTPKKKERATLTKDGITGAYRGPFYDFAMRIDRVAAKWVDIEPADQKTLGARLERVLYGRNKN